MERIFDYNISNGLLFFRITSDLVPFASHPVCKLDWQNLFQPAFRRLGRTARRHGMRISMHPDQFVLINTPRNDVLDRSVAELAYHADVLDLMELNLTARIQIHIGGVYGDKARSMRRFVDRCGQLDSKVRRRLAVENDDRLFTLADCLWISKNTHLPVIFDTLHHAARSSGETTAQGLDLAAATWSPQKGPPMVDYSDQAAGRRPGAHAETLDPEAFRSFLRSTLRTDLDIMLEIKDKERSALKGLEIARSLGRL
jgi:UV DNA damage endonuclease